jgi:hypothetical protein
MIQSEWMVHFEAPTRFKSVNLAENPSKLDCALKSIKKTNPVSLMVSSHDCFDTEKQKTGRKKLL